MSAQFAAIGVKPRTRTAKRKTTVQLVGVAPKRLKTTALQRAEKKNLDILNTTAIVAAQTTASLFLLNGCDDGATATTRVGRRITMTSIYIKWAGSFAATTAGSSPLRLAVVYDKQSNAAAPTATDVFQVDQISTQLNLSNSRRFKVLIDEVVEELGTQGPQSWFRTIYRDFTAGGRKQGLNVEFNTASTANVDSITSGSIYAFIWQNGNIITASPTQALYSRIRFSDS